ncbi:MAG TPA: NADP-dependent glyceraldehyde-3-phosphate dehydrogenase [Rhodospirillaceae bacterium]|nr:NADP-dependent glyceraldehyde-3-phosphate dehydrogenase [Rhodospirillaceae bacterium]
MQNLADLFSAPIPENASRPTDMQQQEYLCNGVLHAWDGACQEIFSPICTPESLVRIRLGCTPLLGETETDALLSAAQKAYDNGAGSWPTMPVESRIRHIEDFTQGFLETREEIIRLLMWEIGKSRADSEREFDRTVQYIRDTIESLKELDRASSRFSITEGVMGQIRRAPMGVVLCMGPFNYPLNETFTTLIPALAMGNVVIVKPPKMGILLFRPLLDIFRRCFPPGVVGFVYGEGAVVASRLMASGGIDVLAFIGTSRVADILKRQHPRPHRLRAVLGLDAKNPAILLPDTDIPQAVSECITGSLSFNGQRCTALKLLFVHKDIAEDFMTRMAEAAHAMSCGMPWHENVRITPLPEKDKPARLHDMISDALGKGATLLNPEGGESAGTLMRPALLGNVGPGMQLYGEEQFGPVVPICTYDDLETPMQYVRTSNYGQQVSIFGQDPHALARLIDPLVNQVCRVNINSQCQRGPDTFPFTGRKDSAEGTLSVSDALRVFSIRTLVAAQKTAQNKEILTRILRDRASGFLSTDFIF